MEGGALPAWQAFAMNGTWFLDQFGKFSHPQVDSTNTHYPKDFPWLAGYGWDIGKVSTNLPTSKESVCCDQVNK